MKKEVILGGAVLSALSLGVVAQADEVTTEQVVQAQEAYETAVATEQELVAQVGAQETVVAQEQATVTAAQSAQAEAEQGVAQAEATASAATPENIAQAEQAVETSKAAVATQETLLETVTIESDISAKQEVVAKQDAVVAAQEAIVARNQADLLNKQEALSKAEKSLAENAQAIADKQNKVSDLTKQVAQAEQAVVAAEKSVDTATQKEQAKAEQLRQANEVLNQANATLSEKETGLIRADADLKKAQAETKKATDVVLDLEAKYGVQQTVTVTDEYVRLMKQYSEGIDSTPYYEHIKFADYYERWRTRIKALGYQSWDAPAELAWDNSHEAAEYDRENEKARQAYLDALAKYRQPIDQALRDEAVKINDLNAYKETGAVDTTTYDIYKLPTEVIVDLSNFASYLINNIREKFGTVSTAVTPTSVQFVDLVTDRVIADNYRGSHYGKALDEISNQLGFLWSGESWYGRRLGRSATLEELKKDVYKNVLGWLTEGISKDTLYFDSQGWGHARHMVGVNNDAEATVEYIGHDYATTGAYFDSFTDNRIKEGAAVNRTVYENPYASYTALFANAQTALNKAKETEATKQTAYTSALGQRDAAKGAVSTAETNLKTVQDLETGLAVAKEQLAVEMSTRQELEQALVTEKKAVTSLQGLTVGLDQTKRSAQEDLSLAEKAVQASQTSLNEEKVKLVEAERILGTATKAVEAAKQALEQAKVDRLAAENRVTALKSAAVALKEAQSALVKAQADIKAKSEQLQVEQVKLADLMNQLRTAKEGVQTSKERYELLKASLAQQELEAKKAQIIQSGRLPQAIYDGSGQVIDYKAGELAKMSDPFTSKPKQLHQPLSNRLASVSHQPPALTYSRVARAAEKTLPATGEVTSILSLVGVGLSALGLVGIKRRR